MTVEWEHVEKNLEEGDPFDHLLALDDSKYVTMRLRQVSDDEDEEQDGTWICAWTVQLVAGKWTIPEIEDWMTRVSERINKECIRADDDADSDA